MQSTGRVEYMFVNVGEDIEIKLTAQHLRRLAGQKNKCSDDDQYSAIDCEERCYWRWVADQTGCRGTWMTDIDRPACNNYDNMTKLIITYRK